MATRFYFRENGTAPISPAPVAGWGSSAAPFARKPMFTTTDAGDALTTVAGFGSTAGQARCHRQLISRPMQAGHVFNTAVSYKCYVQALESATNDNIASRLCVRIVSLDGSVVRHTVLALADYSTATEWNTALRNKAFANGDLGTGSYTTVLGDRLVVEIGHQDAAGASISGSTRWGSAGSADLGENETSTSTTERPWFETSLNLTFANPGDVLQATETDSAQAVTSQKSKAVGQTTEAETALAIAGRKNATTGQPTESDSALAITAQKRVAVGQATETDAALDVTPVLDGGETEVDVGLASETDAALALASRKQAAAGLASSAEAAQPITSRKSAALAQPSEADAALAVASRKQLAVGQAGEADSAQAIAARKAAAVGVATEPDVALPLAAQKRVALGQAVEGQTALEVRPTRHVPLALASEPQSAHALASQKRAAIGPASESDAALSLSDGSADEVAVELAGESDVALAITPLRVVAVVFASENEAALALGSIKRVALGVAVETSNALALEGGDAAPVVVARRRFPFRPRPKWPRGRR